MGIVQRQSLQLTIVSYTGAALGVVNKVFLLTNFLTTDQVGLTNVLTNVALLYAQFSALGIGSIGLRFFPYFENREKKHHGFLFWGSLIVFVGFVIMTLICLLFKPLIAAHFSKDSPMIVEYYNYLIPLAFAIVYFLFFDTYLRALLKTVVATVLYEVIGRLGVTVCITLFAFKVISFHQFVDLYVLSNVLLTLLLLIYMAYLKQLFLLPGRSPLFRRMFKAIMLYGAFTIMNSIGTAILRNIDSIMVAGMLDLSKAGIYTTIFFFPVIISLPYRSIQRTTYPLVARYWRKKDTASMSDLYHKTTLVNMILGGILLIGVWVNLDSIFSFMPKVYSEGRYVFLILAIGVYIDMITGLNGVILVTSKKYKYDLWLMFLLIALTIIANLIFIPKYGMIGAAIAASGSLIIYNIVRVIFVQFFFKMQPFTAKCLWVLALIGCAWLVSLIIPQTANRYVNIALNSIIVSLIYGIPLLLLKLSPDVNKLAYNITKLKFLLPKDAPSNPN